MDISLNCVCGTRGRVAGAGEPKANGTYRQHLFQSTNAANPTYDKSFGGVGKSVRPKGVGPDLWRHSGPGSTARHGPYVLQDTSFGGWFIGSLEPNTWDLYAAKAIAGPWQTCLPDPTPDPTRRDARKSANAGLEPSPQVAFAPAASSAAPAHAAAVAAPGSAAPAPAPAAAATVAPPEAMDLNSDEDDDEDGVEIEAGETGEAEVGEVPPCELWENGSKVDALDVAGTWYVAKVVDERGQGEAREYLVHYNGWKARYDEWVGAGSGRVRAAGSGELGPCKRLAAAATAAKMESGGSEEAAQDPGGAWYQASDVQAEPAEAVGLIGSRIRVWWTGEKAWYAGRVTSVGRGASGSLHTIAYDDGAQATHYLQSAESALNETWEPEEPSPECKTPAKLPPGAWTFFEREAPSSMPQLFGASRVVSLRLLPAAAARSTVMLPTASES